MLTTKLKYFYRIGLLQGLLLRGCNNAGFTVQELGYEENFTISLKLSGSPVIQNAWCTVFIANLINPNMVIPSNASYLMKRFIAETGGVPFNRIFSSEAIFGGSVYDDQFTFVSDPSVGQETPVAYTFKYTENINIEDSIIIKLPEWGVVRKSPKCTNTSLGQDECETKSACYGNDIKCQEQRSRASCTSLSICGDELLPMFLGLKQMGAAD